MNSQLQAGSSRALLVVPELVLRPSCGSLGRLNRPGSWPGARRKAGTGKVYAVSRKNPVSMKPVEKVATVTVKATVKATVGGVLRKLGLSGGLDAILDVLGKSVRLELVSDELDPQTGLQKPTIKGYIHRSAADDDLVVYEGEFKVSSSFGAVGAVLVRNEHQKETYFKSIVLEGFDQGPIQITCNSWVHAHCDNPQDRVFFTDKSYLPPKTPAGLKQLREKELETLRGNGKGERKDFERIYDYDKYNDLGDPDESADTTRPVLGGKYHPYPRRCRTGRPMTLRDPMSESRVKSTADSPYVPRDEAFSALKQAQFTLKTLKSVLHALIPGVEALVVDKNMGFDFFTDIDLLFKKGVEFQRKDGDGNVLSSLLLPRLLKAVAKGGSELLQFEIPAIMDRDKFSWMRDEEFARQTIAGINPYGIQLVKEFPFVSTLDPKKYGPTESAITKEVIEREIKGVMTVEEAVARKKLFVLDYHDILMPYVNKVRALEGTTLYASRTVFFITHLGTLQPVAIELARPLSESDNAWRKVFTQGIDHTTAWVWKLAKCHVAAHDSGIHQLVSHWLRTHCCCEPYVIAANRQLSAMHPIYRLLQPHFRYTMEINGLARQSLINANGIIESCFSPGMYSMELSSYAYDLTWRFDKEALPADLINRGLAEEDPTAEHGLKLVIEDYPFANDGLLIWSAIKQWVTDYVSYYYSDPGSVRSDTELQAFWEEVRTKGHEDKKDEAWWPVLKTNDDLIQVLTTIMWVVSGHHAAVNFGQYPYGGYFPNRPTIARNNLPVEDEGCDEFRRFIEKPEVALLSTFPSQLQAAKVMTVLDVLSSHSPEEEYLGDQVEPEWALVPEIRAAFEKFNGRMKEIEGIIDQRNTDLELRNRTGAGVVPYELLKPFSEPGVTGKGVPTSISI
ncbi:hypothetical protein AMTRI_Chr03g138890 [Amborella trichopoda]